MALSTVEVQGALKKLGYYDGPIDGDYTDPNYRADLKTFQRDYGLVADGTYGPNTEGKLVPLVSALKLAPAALVECRRWQLTTYYVGEVKAWSGPLVPMKTPGGKILANVPAGAFAEAALEGATKLVNGALVGVASPAYSPCDATLFQPVYDIAKRNGWIPDKPGYAGIQLSADKLRAAASRNFDVRAIGVKGWPIEAKNIECDPFRTLAADNGRLPKHDPAFKGKGGVVPAGTKVWVLQLAGKKLPDGTTHDGWCVVNDTGGGIYGAHFDVFTGSRALAKQAALPSRAQIWFEGIETRLPFNYSYGLA